MSLLTAIFLGILQGLTEFLPVSSSGHLVLAQSLIKNFQQPGILFDVMLHLATLLAVLIFFRARVKKLIFAALGIFLEKHRVTHFENKRFLYGIIIATIPTGIIGLYLEHKVETIFASPSYVGYALIFTSVLLIVSDKFKTREEIDNKKSFFLGIVQGFAVIPGISRSGSTVAFGLFLGIKREEIAEFSFLMSVPAILGAVILQVKHLSALTMSDIMIYSAGMAAAFISGLLAISFMIYFIKNASLKIFSLYCLIIGIISIVWM